MRILFLVLVGLFQMLGCLQPVQELVQMVMTTGLVKDPQAVFICLTLSIIVFAALVRYVPGFAAWFQKIEDSMRGGIAGLLSPKSAGSNDVTALAAQVTELTAMVAALQKAAAPATIVTTAIKATPETLNALATGQPATGAPQ